MTKTPILSALSSRNVASRKLKEPFLLPSGKIQSSGPIERSKLSVRWLVLFLASLLLTCTYYCYDNPSALYKPLAEQFGHVDGFDYWFDAMYSVYSIPNVVLPLAGGFLTDHWGLYRALNLFGVLTLCGQIAFAAGCSANSLPMMLIGRFIYGLGGECITVAQTALIERWFCGSGELAFAMGLSLSVSRLGSVLNNVLSPYIALYALSTAAALWVGVGLSALSCACCVVLLILDRHVTSAIKADVTLELAPSPPAMARFAPSPPPATVSAFGSPRVTEPPKTRLPMHAEHAASATSAHVNLYTDCSSASTDTTYLPLSGDGSGGAYDTGGGGGASGGAGGGGDAPPSCSSSMSHAFTEAVAMSARFSRAYWLLSICCVVIYGSVLPFNNVASALLLDRDFFPQGSRWHLPHNRSFVYSTDHPHPPGARCTDPRGQHTPFCHAMAHAQLASGYVMSEPYVMSALLTPILGMLVDRYGGRADLVLFSSTCLLLSHLLLALTAIPAPILLLGIGLGYATFAAVIWPAIPTVVERRQLGTAYGVITAMQNLGLFAIPIAVSVVLDVSHAIAPPIDPNPYAGVSLFFATLAFTAVLTSLHLFADKPTRAALNATPHATSPTPTPSPTPSVDASPGLRPIAFGAGDPAAFDLRPLALAPHQRSSSSPLAVGVPTRSDPPPAEQRLRV